MEIEVLGKEQEELLRHYLELPNGIPSHDTIQRVFAMVPSEFMENFQKRWNEMLNSGEGNRVKRLPSIDGKTQKGNGGKTKEQTLCDWYKSREVSGYNNELVIGVSGQYFD